MKISAIKKPTLTNNQMLIQKRTLKDRPCLRMNILQLIMMEYRGRRLIIIQLHQFFLQYMCMCKYIYINNKKLCVLYKYMPTYTYIYIQIPFYPSWWIFLPEVYCKSEHGIMAYCLKSYRRCYHLENIWHATAENYGCFKLKSPFFT